MPDDGSMMLGFKGLNEGLATNQALEANVSSVKSLESKDVELEKVINQNLQYQRNTNVLINGITAEITHEQLETQVISIFNSVCLHKISDRDIVAVNRI